MNFYRLFYLMSIADRLSSTLLIFSIVVIIFTIILLVFKLCAKDNSDEGKFFKKFVFFKWTILSFFLLLSYILIPSKKDCILIIAGGSIGEFVASDSTSRQIPHDVINFVSLELKKAAEEAKVEIKGLTEKKLEDMSKEELLEKLKEK